MFVELTTVNDFDQHVKVWVNPYWIVAMHPITDNREYGVRTRLQLQDMQRLSMLVVEECALVDRLAAEAIKR